MAISQPSASPLLYSLKETGRLLSMSESSVYRLVRSGELHVVRVHGRTLISVAELERFIAYHSEAQTALAQ
ncbi:MAG: Helix-turn-helix domain [Acidimicrobiaceae bacterium]|nr:Helix-turn-helix domain [Acidimicrobiaceae bacterium]